MAFNWLTVHDTESRFLWISMLKTPADVAQLPLYDAATARTVFDALQAQLLARGLNLRSPPPEPTTCCGRGCNGCVWEGFVAAAQYWRDEALLVLGV